MFIKDQSIKCLASLVGPVYVLSAVVFIMKLFHEQIEMMT